MIIVFRNQPFNDIGKCDFIFTRGFRMGFIEPEWFMFASGVDQIHPEFRFSPGLCYLWALIRVGLDLLRV